MQNFGKSTYIFKVTKIIQLKFFCVIFVQFYVGEVILLYFIVLMFFVALLSFAVCRTRLTLQVFILSEQKIIKVNWLIASRRLVISYSFVGGVA